MSAAHVLRSVRALVAAAEEQGWDNEPDLAPILDEGRQALADLEVVMADADEEVAEAEEPSARGPQ